MLRYPNGVLSSWNDSFHFCDWSGISCGKRHRRVTVIKLKSQGLEGSLSPHVGNLTASCVLLLLKELGLAFNKLVGSVPKEIGFLSKLSIVSIESNNFTGGILPFWGNITLMEVCWISVKFPFGGRIPDTLAVGKSLRKIDAGFRGPLLGVQDQSFDESELAECIPYSVEQGRVLHAYYSSTRSPNKEGVSGLWSKMLILFVLLLLLEREKDDNTADKTPRSTSGTSHHQNSQFRYLCMLKIYAYSIWVRLVSGEGDWVTGFLGGVNSALLVAQLMDNKFTGKLTIDFSKLKDITEVSLYNNNLSGSGEADDDMKFIDSLKNCSSFQVLVFIICNLKDDNQFTGKIPSTIGELKKLEIVALEQNQLSGSIPDAIGNLSLLLRLYLDSNRLEGKIPSSLGNIPSTLGACTSLSFLSLEGNLFKGIIPSSFKSLRGFKKKSKDQTSQSSRKEQFLKVSYNQLLKATDGFSGANLIGLGEFSSVYKGILNDEEFVAVKVLRLQNRRAYKSFLAECEVWRNIRHRNLLKIITSCSSVDFQGNDFKALVYEFMSNGSLHDWLHSSAITSRLNLLQRINILLDVAHALDYLHNHCIPTIVHGDLKPSNILLDDDMVAHVGDFGLARFLGTDLNQNSSTSVKGTIGYAPPEYGMGNEMTSSGDVYSFGILVLEVISGKSPTDDIFTEGLSIHKFAYMALPDHVMDVIDDDVIVLQSTEANAHKMEECLASTLKIGVTCSLDSPQQRMNIKDVVRELQHVMDMLQSI
ncbi:kinase-like domain-containing protein [Tanacetum coccineum]